MIVSYILGNSLDMRKTASRRIINGTRSMPLHLSAYKGYFEIAKSLLDAGAPLLAVNSHKDSVFHIAARHGNTQFVRQMIEYMRENFDAMNIVKSDEPL